MSSAGPKQKLFTVFFMFAVTFVFISLVALVQMVTADTVEQNRTLFQKEAVRAAAGLPLAETTEALRLWYDSSVSVAEDDEGNLDYFRVRTTGEDASETLVIVTIGPGLWGMITAYVGIDTARDEIVAVTFLDHVETPGLGARIDEPWFKQQFVGRRGPFTKLTAEPKAKSITTSAEGSFDQITGATITSTAVKDIINRSLERAAQISNPNQITLNQ